MYEKKRAELMARAQAQINASDFDGFASTKSEIEKLDADHEKAMTAQANLSAMEKEPAPAAMQNFSVPVSGMVAATANTSGIMTAESISTDPYASDEYRHAFMDSVVSGAAIPAKFANTARLTNTAQQTTTGDVGSVIPTTIVNKIVEKMETTGKLWALVTKTSYAGGVSIPTSSAKPTASWVGERGTADTQKKATGSITFAYHKLICKVAISFEVSVVSLDVFEQKIAENIAETMLKHIEIGILSGTGPANNQMTGVLTETVESGQNVNIAKTASVTYADLCKAEGALPQEYDSGAVWCMTKSTFNTCVLGMTDSNGQPVVRDVIGVNGKPQHYILGREVIIVDSSYLPNYASSVDSDTIFAFIFNFKDYFVNTNYAMTVREYIDEDTDDRVKKALMLVDGKTVDKNSLVTVTKKSA